MEIFDVKSFYFSLTPGKIFNQRFTVLNYKWTRTMSSTHIYVLWITTSVFILFGQVCEYIYLRYMSPFKLHTLNKNCRVSKRGDIEENRNNEQKYMIKTQYMV